MKKDKDYIAALFYDISVNYRVMISVGLYDKIINHKNNINNFLDECYNETKTMLQNKITSFAIAVKKGKGHDKDNKHQQQVVDALLCKLNEILNNKKTIENLTHEELECLKSLKLYNDFIDLGVLFLVKGINKNDLIRILIYFYARNFFSLIGNDADFELSFSWFSKKCTEQFLAFGESNKTTLKLQSSLDFVLNFVDNVTENAARYIITEKPKKDANERSKAEDKLFSFYESIKELFIYSLNYKVVASNIDIHNNLSIDMRDNVDRIIYESLFFIPEKTYKFDTKYMHFLSQEDIYNHDLVVSLPTFINEDGKFDTCSRRAYSDVMVGFVIEVAHEEFSIDGTCEQIKNRLYELSRSYNKIDQKAFIESSSSWYGTKNQQKIDQVFLEMIFWNYAQMSKEKSLIKIHEKFLADPINKDFIFTYKKCAASYKKIENAIQDFKSKIIIK